MTDMTQIPLEVVQRLRAERVLLIRRVKALHALSAHLRTQSRPSEKLFKELEATKAADDLT